MAQSLALLTDFYQLSMAYAYWKTGIHKKRAIFHLFFRRLPFHGGFAIASGLESVIDYIKNLKFDQTDIAYLASLRNSENELFFDKEFLDLLYFMQLELDIYAVEEGTAVFGYEPLIRVEGPLWQCQIIESALLNFVNFSTLITTKAARICLAAGDDPVLEFGLRRAQGIDGALTASRAAYVGGCYATSNVLAAKKFGIPVQGTHAHSWIMAFDEELDAFMAYAKCLPNDCVFLVDTYDTIDGVQHAIEVGKWLRSQGKKMAGIRLDSGDLADLSIKSRQLLDNAGFQEAKILASNDLDEIVIAELKHQGAKIAVWGVGTNLVTGQKQPALDGVYKMAAIEGKDGTWEYRLKLSEQLIKVSNPGRLQVRRFTKDVHYCADILYDLEIGSSGYIDAIDPLDPTKQVYIPEGSQYKDLLIPIFLKGKTVYTSPPLPEIQKRTKKELQCLSSGIKRFLHPHKYPVGMEAKLYQIKVELIKNIRKKKRIGYS